MQLILSSVAGGLFLIGFIIMILAWLRRPRVQVASGLQSTMSTSDWYEKARKKAAAFLPSLDPELQVRIDIVRTVPRPGLDSRPPMVYALTFYHYLKPGRPSWPMTIHETDEYIDNELEAAVRQIYENLAVESRQED